MPICLKHPPYPILPSNPDKSAKDSFTLSEVVAILSAQQASYAELVREHGIEFYYTRPEEKSTFLDHYEYVEFAGPAFSRYMGLKENIALMLPAHGDKSRQYFDYWDEKKVPRNAGALIHLLSYEHPYCAQIEGPDRKDWVVSKYHSPGPVRDFFFK